MDDEGPGGRHRGRRYAFGPGLVDVLVVAAVLSLIVWAVSHLIWGHVPDVLVLFATFATIPLGLRLRRWRQAFIATRHTRT